MPVCSYSVCDYWQDEVARVLLLLAYKFAAVAGHLAGQSEQVGA